MINILWQFHKTFLFTGFFPAFQNNLIPQHLLKKTQFSRLFLRSAFWTLIILIVFFVRSLPLIKTKFTDLAIFTRSTGIRNMRKLLTYYTNIFFILFNVDFICVEFLLWDILLTFYHTLYFIFSQTINLHLC